MQYAVVTTIVADKVLCCVCLYWFTGLVPSRPAPGMVRQRLLPENRILTDSSILYCSFASFFCVLAANFLPYQAALWQAVTGKHKRILLFLVFHFQFYSWAQCSSFRRCESSEKVISIIIRLLKMSCHRVVICLMIPNGLHNEAVYYKISIQRGNCISIQWITYHFHSVDLRSFFKKSFFLWKSRWINLVFQSLSPVCLMRLE